MGKNILQTPDITENIINAGLTRGIEYAKTTLGSTQGAVAVAIIFDDGEMRLGSRSFGNEPVIEQGSDENQNSVFALRNDFIVGDATNKIMKSLGRLKDMYSNSSESDIEFDEEYCVEVCYYQNQNGEEIPFWISTAFSGFRPANENFQVANDASGGCWYELSGTKETDGSRANIYRLVGGGC